MGRTLAFYLGPLRYAVCGREEIVNADPDPLTITAADIFAPDDGPGRT